MPYNNRVQVLTITTSKPMITDVNPDHRLISTRKKEGFQNESARAFVKLDYTVSRIIFIIAV